MRIEQENNFFTGLSLKVSCFRKLFGVCSIMNDKKYFMRALTIHDEAILWEMLFHAIFVPPGESAPEQTILKDARIAGYVADWGKADDMGFLALEKETLLPLGATWLRLLTNAYRGYGYFNDSTPELSIAMIPNWRGRGIGTALLRKLLDKADQTYETISLSVDERNPAVMLYNHFGFEIVAGSNHSLTMLRTRNRK
jgi:GNAT superfamily N-acetyltransferase